MTLPPFDPFDPFDSRLSKIHRRDLMRMGGMAALTSCLPGLLGSRANGASAIEQPVNARMFGRAKQVIMLFLSGGPPQHETFDPKPLAPVEIRGPFKPISTNAVIRSMLTNNNIHGGSGYWVLTGRPMLTGDGEFALPTDWPNMASIVKRFRPSERVPALSAVSLPELFIGNGGNIESGQFGGILGPQYSPELIECRPAEPNSPLGGLYASRVPADQIRQRVALLDALGQSFNRNPRSAVVEFQQGLQRQAFDLLTTGGAREAFRLEEESDKLRDRYGRHAWGQSVLLARRLIEAGVRFVTVNWPRVPGDRGVDNPVWDTHARNFDRMEDCLAPQFDVGFTALLDDLSDRGLLDETLVIAVGEFGRTPAVNANAGRDHWGSVFSCVLAGAGIAGGQVYGSSDRDGGYPASDPVDAGHLAATVFHLAGINTQGTFADRLGRELSITEAEPLFKLLGEEPATPVRTTPSGDVAFVSAYRSGLLLHPDFSETTHLPPLDAPASPKGWRASPVFVESNGFGVRLQDRPDQRRTALIGVLASGPGTVDVAANSSAVLTQQIRDPQSGHFTVKAFVTGGGSSAETFQRIFATNFRCRLVIFQFTHASKSAVHRQELASVEFMPTYVEDGNQQPWQTVTVEKRLAPIPGVNFSFGLGIGIALIVEQKTGSAISFSPKSGEAYLKVNQIEIGFEGWKV